MSAGACVVSRVQLFATPWTTALRVLSMGFSRQECWNGLPFPHLPNLGTEPMSLESPAFWQADILPLSHLLDHRVKRQDDGQGIEQVMWQRMKWVANGGPCLQ